MTYDALFVLLSTTHPYLKAPRVRLRLIGRNRPERNWSFASTRILLTLPRAHVDSCLDLLLQFNTLVFTLLR